MMTAVMEQQGGGNSNRNSGESCSTNSKAWSSIITPTTLLLTSCLIHVIIASIFEATFYGLPACCGVEILRYQLDISLDFNFMYDIIIMIYLVISILETIAVLVATIRRHRRMSSLQQRNDDDDDLASSTSTFEKFIILNRNIHPIFFCVILYGVFLDLGLTMSVVLWLLQVLSSILLPLLMLKVHPVVAASATDGIEEEDDENNHDNNESNVVRSKRKKEIQQLRKEKQQKQQRISKNIQLGSIILSTILLLVFLICVIGRHARNDGLCLTESNEKNDYQCNEISKFGGGGEIAEICTDQTYQCYYPF